MGQGKYRNLTRVRCKAVQSPHKSDETGLVERDTRWRVREHLKPRDYLTYHVLIAFVVLIVVIITVTLSVILSPTNVTMRNQHNILLIIADDLGYNDVGYKNTFNDIKTPYIDKLAKESIKLERHYVQPMCSPTRAALFTGRYPFRYGMGGSRAVYYGTRNGLDTSEKLFPEFLKEAGYNTSLIGKWHLGFASWAMTPVRRGFNYFYGTYGGSSTYKTHMSFEGPRQPGYDLFEDRLYIDNEGKEQVNHNVVIDKNNTFSEILFTDKAKAIIKYSADQGKSPFFLAMSYMNPHAPIEPLASDYQQNNHIRNEHRRKYAAMVTSLDYGVGRLLTTLEDTGQLNNTIIVFMSDNGGHISMLDGESLGSSNYPLRGAKCTLYEGGVKVPAFIRIPGVTGDYSYNGLFHVTDWFPTLASFAGLRAAHITSQLEETGHKLDGIDHSDLFATITESEQGPRKSIILDIDPVYKQAGVVAGGFKLLLGDPATLNFSSVYGLLPDNKTHYNSINSGELFQQYQRNEKRQKDYAADPNKCLNVTCISNDVTLYDISVDISENHDISWRFPDKKDELYKILFDVNKDELLTAPIFFEDLSTEALTRDKIWTPWID